MMELLSQSKGLSLSEVLNVLLCISHSFRNNLLRVSYMLATVLNAGELWIKNTSLLMFKILHSGRRGREVRK